MHLDTQVTPIPTPLMMAPEQMQRANEFTYARRYVERYLRFELDRNTEVQANIDQCVQDILVWMYGEYYESKQLRLSKLKAMDIEQLRALVERMLNVCVFAQKPELFTSITGQLAGTLGWDSRRQAIITLSELLTHLHRNNLIRIVRIESGGIGAKFKKSSLAILSTIPISNELTRYIAKCRFLPPLLCEPKTITRNNQSGYLTFNKPVTLNGWTDGQLSLDVLNIQNKTAFTLDLEFLMNVEEIPNKILDTAQKQTAWEDFIHASQEMYLLIHTQSQGNRECPGALYFIHDFDLRGRMYAEGYHINYQGSPYKKAMLEFAEPEFVAVPEEFQLPTYKEQITCTS